MRVELMDMNAIFNALPPEFHEEWNTIHGKEWKRVTKIGAGGYGSVFIGQRVEDDMVFAVKSTPLLVRRTPVSNIVALQNEMTTLSQIRMLGCGRSNGSNIGLGCVDSPANVRDNIQQKETAMVMLDLFLEYIPRGSLRHLMRRLSLKSPTPQSISTSSSSSSGSPGSDPIEGLPEDYVRAYAADILKAVDYLHRKQFVHGDIKPLNLLVAEDCLKLADFGGCKTLKKKTLDSMCIHTSAYSAPEVYYGVEQGFASDIFSVGCTVLEMFLGHVPDPLYIPQSLSPEGQNFLRRCVTGDPYKRWTAAQLLEHPFIRDKDQNDTRPYSTVIPQGAESMILHPPPVEFYTDTILSPTYRGTGAFRGPTPPQKLNWMLYGKHLRLTGFHRENIKISSQPPKQTTAISPPSVAVAAVNATHPKSSPVSRAQIVAKAATFNPKPDEDDSTLFSIVLSPLPHATAAHAAPTASNHVSRAQVGAVASASRSIPISQAAGAVTNITAVTTSNPGSPARIQAPVPVTSKSCFPIVRSKSSRTKPTLQDLLVKEPERELKVSSRPEFGYRSDPKDTDSRAAAAAASTNFSRQKGKEVNGNDQKIEAPILPDYKPEFVPPEDHNLHFLLPVVTPKKDKHKYADLDARAAELLKDSPRMMNRKPPPLLIPGASPDTSTKGKSSANSGTQHKNVNFAPEQMLQPTDHKLQQLLLKSLHSFREYNEEIKEEARMAEEAGIYDNKLCPGASEGNSSKSVSPRKGRSNNRLGTECFTRPLLGCSSTAEVDSNVVLNRSREGSTRPSNFPELPLNLKERQNILNIIASRFSWGR